MIEPAHDLAITKQAKALNISRGSVYYLPRPVPESDLAIMRRLDRLHLEFPFAGSRMLRGLLAAEGCKIGRRHVKTLMKRMGIEALYRRPRTTKPEPGHKIYPYLLRGMEIVRPNQVWAMDITYIPMERGSAVVVAPNGDIYVADMRTSGWRSPHRATTNGTMHRTGSSPTTLRDVTAHPLTIAGLQNSGGAP
jgi:hypothetical protein